MNLDEVIFNCLTEFTNPENEVRQEAEQNFENIVRSNKSDEILNSLLRIIDTNRQSTISFSALIQLRYYAFYFIASKLIDDEYLIFFRKTIQQFIIDSAFSNHIRKYMIDILGVLFVFSFYPQNLPYPEIFEFLDEIIQIPELYANVIEFYTNFIKPSISPDLFDFYNEERIHFIFSHLDQACSQEDRSQSAVFFIYFWDKYSSTLSSLIDFLSILNELDNEHFRYMTNHLTEAVLYEKIELNVQVFYDIFYNRIVDDKYDDLFRQYCLYHLIMLISSSKSIYQIFISNLPKFMEMILIVTSDPQNHLILYDECKESINNMRFALGNCPPLAQMLITLIENSNPYVSSLFYRFALIPSNYQNGILFSSQDDPIIRENGLCYLRKLLKHRTKQLYMISNNVVEEIGSCLLECYTKFKDASVLKVLSVWCNEIQSETLSNFSDSIVDLCTNVPCYETIKCGSALLRLNDKKDDNEDNEFAVFLLQNVDKILSDDCQLPLNSSTSLRGLVDCLPGITRFVSSEKRIEFMNFIVPIICSDVDALFSKNLCNLLIQLGENINLYESILDSLFKVYSDAVDQRDSTQITNFLYSIIKYGKLFSSFESTKLQLFLKICVNIIKEDTSFTEDAIPDAIKSIGKMLSYFENNDELFNSAFELAFTFIFDDDDIENVRYYLKLIYKLTLSNFFDEERALFTLNNIKPLFDHSIKVIEALKESDNAIDSVIALNFNKISELFYNIFYSLFSYKENLYRAELYQIISTDFLDISSVPLEMQTSVVDIYLDILKDEEKTNNMLDDKLIQNLANILSMMPTEQDGYQEMISQLSFSDIASFFHLQNILVTGLGNLFYPKKVSIENEFVDNLFDFIEKVVSLKDENYSNGELSEFQERCIFCLSKLIVSFQLNEGQTDEKVLNLIAVVYQWLPYSVLIDDSTFNCYFQILLFCISTNIFENNEKIQEMMTLLCNCIINKKVSDAVLRTIYNNYFESDLKETIDPLLVEIQNFL